METPDQQGATLPPSHRATVKRKKSSIFPVQKYLLPIHIYVYVIYSILNRVYMVY